MFSKLFQVTLIQRSTFITRIQWNIAVHRHILILFLIQSLTGVYGQLIFEWNKTLFDTDYYAGLQTILEGWNLPNHELMHPNYLHIKAEMFVC
jgi:hypothetical protein